MTCCGVTLMTAKAGESHHGKKKERKKGGQIVVQKDKSMFDKSNYFSLY